jgi:selT/selW/selH-like putative selenoprotein
LTDELLNRFGPYIEALSLLPASGGRFEVTVNSDLIFSKLALQRHAEPGEVARLFGEKTGFQPVD